MSLPDFSDYQSFEKISSCYLDGRYFNLVFNDYPGLIENPLQINLQMDQNALKTGVFLEKTKINLNYVGLLKIVITTDNARHCNLALIEYSKKKIIWFFPAVHRHQMIISKLLTEYFALFFPDYLIYPVDFDLTPEQNEDCPISGFCVAYCIKYAYDYLLNQPINLTEIRRFAKMVEDSFDPLDPNTPDVEYGPFDEMSKNQFTGVLIGGVGGAAIGGLAAGPAGALVGAGLGGVAGYAIGSRR